MSTFGAFHCLNVFIPSKIWLWYFFSLISLFFPFGRKIAINIGHSWGFNKIPLANYPHFYMIELQYLTLKQRGVFCWMSMKYIVSCVFAVGCFFSLLLSSDTVYRTVTKSFNGITMKIDRKKNSRKLFITINFFFQHHFSGNSVLCIKMILLSAMFFHFFTYSCFWWFDI